MKNYTKEEIEKRTRRILQAQKTRQERARLKDEIVLWHFKQVYPEGMVRRFWSKWIPFPYSFSHNSIKRLLKEKKLTSKSEINHHNQVEVRYFYNKQESEK